MHKLRVIPLGGCGEIGKNMTLFEYNNQGILVDAGIMFPENDHLGIDYIIPDMGYVMENFNRLKIMGIIVTHGHEDHTGAIGHVMEIVDAPIYATPLTAGILKIKLKEAKQHHSKVNVIQAGDKFKVGVFEIETFHVTHSIPDCVGLGIRTPVGLVVHTGDFKFDHTPVDNWPPDFGRIARMGQEGVLALFSDSTNADRPGWTPSEMLVADGFDRVFSRAEGRIMVATFASLISRVEQVADACQKYNRKMTLVGTSMVAYVNLSLELGYLDFPKDLLVPISKANKMPPDQITYMVTGSQGEPSAVLSRLAVGRQPQLEVRKGDTVIISAHPIPGNEEMIQRTINKLIQKGADVVYDPIEQVHVSGHASQEEMKLMINMIQPRYFVPIHGELRHLHSHTRLAIQLGIPEENCAIVENGTIIEFAKDSMTIGDRYPGGYVFVDGRGVGDIGPAVMRDREILGSEGFVTIFAAVDRRGNMVKEPRIISRGFVYLRESEQLFVAIKDAIRRSLGKTSNGRRNEAVEEAVSRVIYQETKRRPMVFAHIHQEVAE